MAKRGKPKNILVADLTDEWGSPLAIMKDSFNYIITTQLSNGKWGGNNNKYYPTTNDGMYYLFKALRGMFVARGTKKAANFAELADNFMKHVTASNEFMQSIASKLNVGV